MPSPRNPPKSRRLRPDRQLPAPAGDMDPIAGPPARETALARDPIARALPDDSALHEGFKAAAKSKSTRRSYRAVLERFEAYCRERRVPDQPAPPPPKVVGQFLSHMAASGGFKVATIGHTLAALSTAYRMMGVPGLTKHPDVSEAWQGIQNELGWNTARKAPIAATDLLPLFDSMRQDLRGNRDRALLLLGFFGGFRRSELVAIDVEDLQFDPEGVTVQLPRSKTNQEGKEEEVSILNNRRQKLCAVAAVKKWLEHSGITTGPLFRAINRHGRMSTERLTDQSVASLVKQAAIAAGFDPKAFGGHSLRRGLVTSAAKAGKATHVIMKQTRHRDVKTLLKYIEQARRYEDNVTEGL